MTRMHRLAKPSHGSRSPIYRGTRACPCHASPPWSPPSVIRQKKSFKTLLANASNTGMIQCKEKVSKESLSKEESHVDVSPSVGNHSRGNGACGPCSLSERDIGDAAA